MSRSPWERVLGASREGLHPQLRDYFGPIPLGRSGVGVGVFRVVGTPRRWLWPVLALLARDGLVFPVWARNVPFTVRNRPTAAGTVRAQRVFHFDDGDRVMEDEIGITRAGLVDRLGRRGLIDAHLRVTVFDGALRVTSTGVTLRLGPVRVPLGPLSPRVWLNESAVDVGQRVQLRIELPILGVIYEYDGTFTYSLEDRS